MNVRLVAGINIAILIVVLVSLALFRDLGVYVTIIALGLALALQKYVASYFSYFVIQLGHIFGPGDRIRIGSFKGDVRRVGLLHTVLEEVGEDEKLGGELTGRLLHIPNLIILDQPVLNYSKDYSIENRAMQSDYIFDEVRIPLMPQSDIRKAKAILEEILVREDKNFVEDATKLFGNGYPHFLAEARADPRVVVHIEPREVWLKGKFVAPMRGRNELRSRIILEFLDAAHNAENDLMLT